MLLTTWPLPDFVNFLQILTWIILPVLLLSILLTMLVHYRRNRKKRNGETPGDILLPDPSADPLAAVKDTHILFDHTGLIRQYRQKLSYHHARYAALQQDYKQLHTQYSQVLAGHRGELTEIKNNTMENLENTSTFPAGTPGNGDQQEPLLQERLEQLDAMYKQLESENQALLEQVSVFTATADEKDQYLHRWKEENKLLKAQVNEQGYLEELVKEQKNQVLFLQNQVEEKVRTTHRLTRELEDTRAESEALQELKSAATEELNMVKNEMNLQDLVIGQLRADLAEQETLAGDKQSIIDAQGDQLTYMKTQVQEFREQNELLQAELADNRDQIQNLREQLSLEESKSTSALQKLEDKQQVIRNLHRVLSESIGEEISQVIELKPAYGETQGWG